MAWMRPVASRAALLGLLMLGSAMTSACDPDPLFMDCPLSESIVEVCAAQSENTDFTCVVTEHPYCLERICASWKGAPSRCTRACTSDAQCPAGSSCQTHLENTGGDTSGEIKFCVLDEDIPEGQSTTPTPDASGSSDVAGD